MLGYAIVSYIDVLGYKRIVDKLIDQPAFIEELERLYYGISISALKELQDIALIENETDREVTAYYKKVIDSICVRCIADSFIFTLQVPEIDSKKEFDERGFIKDCVSAYFGTIKMFSQLFICKAGLLRGGISIGKHYESEKEQQLFIFSQAHNRACEMEKEARTPRIRIDESVRLYLDDISSDLVWKFFYRDDEDGCLCLDIYKGIQASPRMNNILDDIKRWIEFNIKANWNNKKELGMIIAFAKYHNSRVNSEPINFPAASLEYITKCEDQYKILKKQKGKKSKRK